MMYQHVVLVNEHSIFKELARGSYKQAVRNPSLLKKRTSVGGYTPLMIAVIYGQFEVVEWLLRQPGFSLSERDSNGDTALLHAVLNQDFEITRHLVEHGGADITESDETGISPLLLAAAMGSVPIVEYLIKCGADVESRDNFNHTCLMSAAYKGDLHMIQCLLERGARIDAKDDWGYSALLFAIENNRENASLFLYYCIQRAKVPCLNDLPHELRDLFEEQIEKEISGLKETAHFFNGYGFDNNLIKMIHSYQSGLTLLTDPHFVKTVRCLPSSKPNIWMMSVQMGLLSGFLSSMVTRLGCSIAPSVASGTMLAAGILGGYQFFKNKKNADEDVPFQVKRFLC